MRSIMRRIILARAAPNNVSANMMAMGHGAEHGAAPNMAPKSAAMYTAVLSGYLASSDFS